MKCFLCDREACDLHHVFNGAMKKKSEQYGAMVYLCRSCHDKLHNGKDQKDMQNLKQHFQRQIMIKNDWNIDDFRAVFKKNYLSGDEEDD